MTTSLGLKYTVKLHADATDNIVLDGVDIGSFNAGSFADPTAAITTLKVNDRAGVHIDAFEVITCYGPSYAGTDPATLTLAQHAVAAYNVIQAAIVAGNFPGGGPSVVITSLGSIVPGSNYLSRVHYAKLTGGSGSGATAHVTVAGGGVTTVVLVDNGYGYQAGDVLSAHLDSDPLVEYEGGAQGSGFTVTVTGVGSPLTNTTY